MNVETKLKELLALTAIPNADSDKSTLTGEVELEQLSDSVKAFIQQNQQVEIKLPDFGNIHTSSKEARSIPAFFKLMNTYILIA